MREPTSPHYKCLPYPAHLHHLIAEVVDDFDGISSRRKLWQISPLDAGDDAWDLLTEIILMVSPLNVVTPDQHLSEILPITIKRGSPTVFAGISTRLLSTHSAEPHLHKVDSVLVKISSVSCCPLSIDAGNDYIFIVFKIPVKLELS
ncbi:MAG: hypothetical protein WCL42_07575 [Chlorobiaceae bacterium]